MPRLLPNREVPPDIEITENMLRLQAFRVEQKEQGSASLSSGDRSALKPISEFGAKPYTEDEERSLSEIIKAFNERHGTQFSRDEGFHAARTQPTLVYGCAKKGRLASVCLSAFHDRKRCPGKQAP
jgi:hypothetical protein